uniref:UDP-glucose 4-epimerase n=2 Tax=Nyssomyia neivai TaxID=330878 RepID=A0A1L8E3I8_9DIPT
MTKQTVLVTGGAGYVGSHTILELLNASYDVICVDNLCNAFRGHNATLPESLVRVQELSGHRVTFYDVDIRSKEALMDVFSKHKIDCVAHFAALKAVGESCKYPLQYYQNNITGTSVLLEVMAQAGCYNFVYSSSATVYGEPEFLPLTEAHPTGKCTSPYGKSKYFTEEILKDLCESDKRWNAVALRYFNPVGAHPSGKIGEDPNGEPNNLMPYISQVAVGRRPILKVYGTDYPTKDGTGVRDYIHIVDLAVGHVKALDRLGEGKIRGFVAFNLGTGAGYSVLEMVDAFSTASGVKIPFEKCPRRPGDIAESYADATLAAKSLNWSAQKGIKEMCTDTWNWQQTNPNGYSAAKL